MTDPRPETVEASPAAPIPAGVPLLGLAIALAAGLPITPQGASFLQLLWASFRRGMLEGVLMLVGFGSPFLFGLALFVGVVACSRETATRLVRIPIALMHAQLVLVAAAIVRGGEAIAAWALLGFAVVSGAHLAHHTARSMASDGRGPSLQWYARWGAMVVAAIAGWSRMQRLGGVELGLAVDVVGVCALGIVFMTTLRGRRARAADRADVDAG